MSVWTVLAIGIVSVLIVSALVALSIGAILGHISRQVTELLDLEPWEGAPSTTGIRARTQGIDWRRTGVGLRPGLTNRG